MKGPRFDLTFPPSDATSKSPDGRCEAASLPLLHHRLSHVVLASGLQRHKHWQEAIMLLTRCAASLFMRSDSSLRTAAHQLALSTYPHREKKRKHTEKKLSILIHTHACMQTNEHTHHLIHSLPQLNDSLWSNTYISVCKLYCSIAVLKCLPWSSYCFKSCCGLTDGA